MDDGLVGQREDCAGSSGCLVSVLHRVPVTQLGMQPGNATDLPVGACSCCSYWSLPFGGVGVATGCPPPHRARCHCPAQRQQLLAIVEITSRFAWLVWTPIDVTPRVAVICAGSSASLMAHTSWTLYRINPLVILILLLYLWDYSFTTIAVVRTRGILWKCCNACTPQPWNVSHGSIERKRTAVRLMACTRGSWHNPTVHTQLYHESHRCHFKTGCEVCDHVHLCAGFAVDSTNAMGMAASRSLQLSVLPGHPLLSFVHPGRRRQRATRLPT
jgi:hypothetical protein